MNTAMLESLRLTREGRLAEATAVIQRTLHGWQAPPDEHPRPNRLLEGTAPPRAAAESRDAGATARSSPRSSVPPAAGAKPSVPVTVRRVGAYHPRPVPPRGPVDVAGPGRWIAASHRGAAGARDYKLYVPSGYTGQPLPLVVMLHGCTQGPDDFAAGTGMNGVGEAERFLVAYPAQAPAASHSKCWNWFDSAHQHRDGEPALIAGVARQVMGEYAVDPGCVYVAGLSAGGAMAAVLGASFPELFAAVGVHSGLAPGCAHDLPSALKAMRQGGRGRRPSLGRPAPLILFHGDADATVHPSNADELVRQWGGAARANVRRGQEAGGRAYTCEIYQDREGRPVVERWTIHGGGHAWSGGSRHGSYTDPAGPNASRELARFFREHRRETGAAGGKDNLY